MSSLSAPAVPPVPVALAAREGNGGAMADAGASYTAADGTVAAVVVDGIGHKADIVALAPVLAEVAARIGARRGALAGLLTAALLLEDRGAFERGPNAAAALVVARPGRPAVGVWAGDVRIHGVSRDGDLQQYSTDETWGQQLRDWGVPVDVAQYGDELIRKPLSRATATTLTEVQIPAEETVLLTTDGVHDHLKAGALAKLARRHAHAPQALADCLVAAALPDADGNLDDALALVLPRGENRLPRHEPAGAAGRSRG